MNFFHLCFSQLFNQRSGPLVAPEKGSPAPTVPHGSPAPRPHAESGRTPEWGRMRFYGVSTNRQGGSAQADGVSGHRRVRASPGSWTIWSAPGLGSCLAQGTGEGGVGMGKVTHFLHPRR